MEARVLPIFFISNARILFPIFLALQVCNVTAQNKYDGIRLDGIVYDTILTTKHIPSMGARVTLVNKISNKRISVKTDSIGGYSFKLNPDTDYVVFASKKTYHNSINHFISTKNINQSNTIHQDLNIGELNYCGPSMVGIFYGFDSADLRKSSYGILDTLVSEMTSYPHITVEISSHSDCREKNKMDLSEKRSEIVINYLVAHGIDKERLVAKAHGDTQLLNTCACDNGKGPGINCTEEEHQLNRRSEFKILRLDYYPENSKGSDH